ncbi:MAG: BtrH N-terminal domain-containing protein [Dysgonamonadaceae bacterium]|jgi:hypothetical protein|nr:BtrH N-terminal domain-containing protein [Dysgonamonadaceae bacterium]
MIDYSLEFAKKSFPAFDCRLCTFRNNLSFYGYPLSHSSVFGISGSFVFAYCDAKINKRSPFPLITGIFDQSIESLATGLNCYLMKNVFEVNDQYFDFIHESLENRVIVNICVDFFLLQKYVYKNQTSDESLFSTGIHYISIVGCNRERRELIAVDTTTSSQIIVLTDDILKKIWFSDKYKLQKDPYFSANGEWFSINVPPHIDTGDIINCSLNAIKRVIQNFFSPPALQPMGLTGLDKFREDIIAWFIPYNYSDFIQNGINLIYFFNKNFNGGGLARKQYSLFLNHLSSMLCDEHLKIISSKFAQTSIYWTNFIESLKRYADNGSLCSNNEDLLAQFSIIYDAEKEQMQLLYEWFNNYGIKQYNQLNI